MNTALGSRAVIRRIEPGIREKCAHCGELVMFKAWVEGRRGQRAIANVYVDGRWDRVEHFHASCYKAAGEPYGPAADSHFT